jgi:hypothetical protein
VMALRIESFHVGLLTFEIKIPRSCQRKLK